MSGARRDTFGEGVARAAYSMLVRGLAPLMLARAWWRGRAEPAYRASFTERWGWYRRGSVLSHSATTQTAAMALAPASVRPLWIHSVSLGETVAASALVDALRRRDASIRFLLTQGTATGRAAAALLLQPGDAQTWLPIDTPGAVARFLDHFRPEIGVLMETEIWPNLMNAAALRHLPMVLANGRLSARSLRSGQRVGLVLRPAFERLRLALAQSGDDAERLRAAGVTDVRVAGNLKFDLEPEPALIGQGQRWRSLLQRASRAARDVVLAAVTREGEEEPMLDAWLKLASRRSPSRPLFVIVPRHPQRFEAVAQLVEARGLRLARRSGWANEPPTSAFDADVWLGDSMREMATWYSMADVALLGGSFEPLGGQNLIEAAACGCPVVMGPHTFNFAAAAAGALEAGAAQRVADVDEGMAVAIAMLDHQHPDDSAVRSSRARAFAAAHRGAADRMADAILASIRSS